jgi:hypothetical protein
MCYASCGSSSVALNFVRYEKLFLARIRLTRLFSIEKWNCDLCVPHMMLRIIPAVWKAVTDERDLQRPQINMEVEIAALGVTDTRHRYL